LKVLGSIENGSTVEECLDRCAADLNDELSNVPGSIEGLECDVGAGPTGGNVRIVVFVGGERVRSKEIVWANCSGSNRENALSEALNRVNSETEDLEGEVADFHLDFISPPLPKRVYATLIVALNGKIPKKVDGLSPGERQERLLEVVTLLGGDPGVINISKVADAFDVSRETIYRDLHEIDFPRK